MDRTDFWSLLLSGKGSLPYSKGDLDHYIFDSFTIANEMLSLRGSIQPDPFSPAHVPHMSIKAMSEPTSESSTTVVRDSIFPYEEEEDEGEDEDGIDTFERLGRMGDEAVALEAKRKAEEAREAEAVMRKEKESKKKKKKKRKNGVDEEGNKVTSKSRHKRSQS